MYYKILGMFFLSKLFTIIKPIPIYENLKIELMHDIKA